MIRKLNLFGDYLKHARYKSGKSPRDICRILRIDLEDYKKWEGNTDKPDYNTAKRLAKHLKIDEDTLLRLL